MYRFLSATLIALVAFAGCASEERAPDAAPEAPQASAEPSEPGSCEPIGGQDLPSPGACAAVALGSTGVEVQYHRPSKKDREIFGSLVPYGDVWRTGANEATTLTTTGPLTIGGETLPAGTYALFTIPTAAEWTLIVNEVADQWGAFDYDETSDVLRTTATPESGNAAQEQFEISFENATDSEATMVLAWDDVRVPVTISVAG